MTQLKGAGPGNPSPARDCGVLKAQLVTGVKARIPANVLDVCLQAARRISDAWCQGARIRGSCKSHRTRWLRAGGTEHVQRPVPRLYSFIQLRTVPGSPGCAAATLGPALLLQRLPKAQREALVMARIAADVLDVGLHQLDLSAQPALGKQLRRWGHMATALTSHPPPAPLGHAASSQGSIAQEAKNPKQKSVEA